MSDVHGYPAGAHTALEAVKLLTFKKTYNTKGYYVTEDAAVLIAHEADRREAAQRQRAEKAEARVAELEQKLEGATTMVACRKCAMGVRARDAVVGLCRGCAEARVGHLEAECAKLRRLVSEAFRDGFAAGCFPNANVDDAWPQSMTFADLNAEANHE